MAERNGITHISEARPMSWYRERMAHWDRKWPAVRLENPLLRADVVPALGGRIVSIYSKASHRELLLPPQPNAPEYPYSAGYEEYSVRGARGPGRQEAYEYRVEEPGRRVAMWATLENGLRLERTIELAANEAKVTVSSRLINPSGEEKQACLRAHPIVSIGPTEQVIARFTDLAGKSHSIRLSVPPGKSRGQMFREGDARPNGQWEVTNTGLGVGGASKCLVSARSSSACSIGCPADSASPWNCPPRRSGWRRASQSA